MTCISRTSSMDHDLRILADDIEGAVLLALILPLPVDSMPVESAPGSSKEFDLVLDFED